MRGEPPASEQQIIYETLYLSPAQQDYDDYKILVATNAEPSEATKLRRLFYECGTILQQDLKRKHGGTEGETLTPLADGERIRRRRDLRTRLHPMKLRGPLEHAYCTDDDVVVMYNENFAIYLHPKHCPPQRTRDSHGRAHAQVQPTRGPGTSR